MSPSRRPLSVARLARVFCLGLMLATWLPAWPAQSAANPTPSAGSPADRIPTEVWQVTWKASIDGNATTSELNLTRQTRINASIIVNFYTDGTSEYYANEYTATYLYSSRWEYFCSYGGRQLNYDLFRVTDPGRYNGTGPIAANGVMPLRPVEYEGKWILPAINMSLGPFTLSKHQENQECKEPFYSSDRTDSNSHLYLDYVTYMFGSLTSDNNAVFESQLTTETPMETYDVPYTLYQQNYLRVERLKGQNLKVHDIEVTQGLQLNNTIPLVQGRSTIVRAYIDIGAAAGPIAKVGARLKVYGGGGLLGERWPLNKGGVISAKRTPDWHKIDDTLNFAIPWIWTQSPSLRFEVEVNHTRLLYETDYTDNRYSVELPLRDCQPLEIGYLPVRFAPPGVTPSSPDPAIAFAHEWMVRVYPVADDELLYQPLPGITWKRKIDGLTQSETLENGAVLLDSLDQLESLSTAPSSSLWAVAWLPGAASQWLDGMSATGDQWRGQRAWVAQKKAPRNIWQVLLAHEAGHAYGAIDTTATTGGYHWFDLYADYIKPQYSSEGLLDFMQDPNVPTEVSAWVSPQTYLTLYDRFCYGISQNRSSRAQAAADVLVISGSVSLSTVQSGQLNPVFRTAGTQRVPPAGWNYYVALKNGATELSRYGFDPSIDVAAAQPYEPTTAPFLLSVPFVPGVNRVELLDKNGAMLASRTASAHSPSITVQFPNAAGLTLDGVQTIQWTGSDLDGDALTYSVLYSEDNGATWDALAAGLAETTYEADFGSIPGSSAASIKVLASDGFNTSADVSDQTFAVPAKAPLALIVSPTPGATFSAGETIKLQGYGVDLEDGSVASDKLNWSSSRDGALGTGGLLEVTLSEGTHTITLAIAGSTSRATTTVLVEAEPPPAQKSYTHLPLLRR